MNNNIINMACKNIGNEEDNMHIKQINKNVSKKQAVIDIFNPNDNGISHWKTREELKGTPLELTKNGNCRHGVFYGDNRFKWDTQRESSAKTSKIIALRTNGYNVDKQLKIIRPISKKNREEILKIGKCVACGNTSSLVVDHKND